MCKIPRKNRGISDLWPLGKGVWQVWVCVFFGLGWPAGKCILYWPVKNAISVSFSQPLNDFSTFSESSKTDKCLEARRMKPEFCWSTWAPWEWTWRLGEGVEGGSGRLHILAWLSSGKETNKVIGIWTWRCWSSTTGSKGQVRKDSSRVVCAEWWEMRVITYARHTTVC